MEPRPAGNQLSGLTGRKSSPAMAKRFHFSGISPPDLSGSRKHSVSVMLAEYPPKALILMSVEFGPTLLTDLTQIILTSLLPVISIVSDLTPELSVVVVTL
jgi:hypothetical protein